MEHVRKANLPAFQLNVEEVISSEDLPGGNDFASFVSLYSQYQNGTSK
jgi:hypothetical protein